MGRLILICWLATGLLVLALIASGSGVAWIIAGTLLCCWGWGVATNYRGVVGALPTRFGIGGFWQETSAAMIRLTFAFFAVIGALFVFAAAARSA